MLVADPGVEQAIRTDWPSWIPAFTGLSQLQFRTLVGIVADRGGEQCRAGRRWGPPLADRVLLVAVHYRTNLTLRQVAPFGVLKSAAGRIVEHLAGHLVLEPVEGRHPNDTVLIVDGTLVPTWDRQIAEQSNTSHVADGSS